MNRNTAKAHINPNYTYSEFHNRMLNDVEGKGYALHHIYSVQATRYLLQQWGWSHEEIKVGSDNLTIDVQKASVYVHIPNKIIKHGEKVKIRGISRQVKKADYIQILIDRAFAKADPYKLQPGNAWNQFIAMGNTGDFYQIELKEDEIWCSCHACRGLHKAFEEDAIAFKTLLQNPTTLGQLPDKHVFAVWKYLNAHTHTQYQSAYRTRQEAFFDEINKINFELRFNQRVESKEDSFF